jgi:hypothetical protein
MYNDNQLKLYLQEDDIKTAWQDQLNKDFYSLGIQLLPVNHEELLWESAQSQISKALDRLINTQYSQFLNLLYRIDVPESKIASSLQNKKKDERDVDIIAELILKRELQKVVLKKYFK